VCNAIYGVKGAYFWRARPVAPFPVIAAERICDQQQRFFPSVSPVRFDRLVLRAAVDGHV
jgi:hypothetical protein